MDGGLSILTGRTVLSTGARTKFSCDCFDFCCESWYDSTNGPARVLESPDIRKPI